jgi:hypothetical protein
MWVVLVIVLLVIERRMVVVVGVVVIGGRERTDLPLGGAQVARRSSEDEGVSWPTSLNRGEGLVAGFLSVVENEWGGEGEGGGGGTRKDEQTSTVMRLMWD